MDYNQKFFIVFRKMPSFYQKVVSAFNNEEKRKALEEMYDYLQKMIPQTFAYSILPPDEDIDLIVYNDIIIYLDGIKSITDLIKCEQLKKYQGRKEVAFLDSCEESRRKK